MMVIKENFKNDSKNQSLSKSTGKEGTLPKFLAFYALLIGWCSLVIYSMATS
ncbi:hypothetical protein VIN01S_06090 [Vibrio inusitatus NBRC 102082]|uniref:Uncharacterized protein n=1 Tax=Vibrio inusitatus NBRC 102082 TaxID=1219070 RepID=A0A4Y3HS03_9VIBR|nr:hypothetical protein [Vibrio inusitatus]GEA49805.1 hypothetical protein VIN01S_06090 [Vibrio inusitatus NBRC 102082]